MRRLLCHWSYSPPDGGGVACRHASPRRFFSASLTASLVSLGWGVAPVAPQPVFSVSACAEAGLRWTQRGCVVEPARTRAAPNRK